MIDENDFTAVVLMDPLVLMDPFDGADMPQFDNPNTPGRRSPGEPQPLGTVLPW
jgi:hypothetical protein